MGDQVVLLSCTAALPGLFAIVEWRSIFCLWYTFRHAACPPSPSFTLTVLKLHELYTSTVAGNGSRVVCYLRGCRCRADGQLLTPDEWSQYLTALALAPAAPFPPAPPPAPHSAPPMHHSLSKGAHTPPSPTTPHPPPGVFLAPGWADAGGGGGVGVGVGGGSGVAARVTPIAARMTLAGNSLL